MREDHDALVDTTPVTGDELVDDPLLARLQAIESLPLEQRASAIEALNRTLVGALNELEQL